VKNHKFNIYRKYWRVATAPLGAVLPKPLHVVSHDTCGVILSHIPLFSRNWYPCLHAKESWFRAKNKSHLW